MTFIGEAARLDWANPISGTPFEDYGYEMTYLDDVGSPTPTTLTAGDAFMVGFYDYDYLSETDAAEFFLTFETTSGSGGVTVSWGFDPDWDLTEGVAVNGTTSATIGTGITPVPLAGVDPAQYWAQEQELTVKVTVTSGSFTVDQLRLRIWPPGGALGGWSSVVTPSEVEELPITNYRNDRWTANLYYFEGLSSFSSGQAELRSRLDAATIDPIYSGSSWNVDGSTTINDWPQSFFYAVRDNGGGGSYATSGESHCTRIVLDLPAGTPNPGGTDGVDYFRPPDSTNDYYDIVGPTQFEWGQSVITVVHSFAPLQQGSPSAYWWSDDGPFYIQVDDGDFTKPTAPAGDASVSTSSGRFTGTFARSTAGTVDLSSFAATQTFGMTVFHEGVVTAQSNIGGVGEPTIAPTYSDVTGSGVSVVLGTVTDAGNDADWPDFDPITVLRVKAPFRYWALVATVPPLRQRNRDDVRARLRASRQRSIRARGYL